jgi:hypothetical protein
MTKNSDSRSSAPPKPASSPNGTSFLSPSPSNYIKLANDLRKYYLRKGMDASKTRYLTIEQLMELNDKYGSATDIPLSMTASPRDIQRKMARLLSDPFLNRKRGVQTATSYHAEKGSHHREMTTPTDYRSPYLNEQA